MHSNKRPGKEIQLATQEMLSCCTGGKNISMDVVKQVSKIQWDLHPLMY